jgi:hypothetical protein
VKATALSSSARALISGVSMGASIASMRGSWSRHFSPRAVAQSDAEGFSFMAWS